MNSETSAGAHAGLEVPVLESSSSNDQQTQAPETTEPQADTSSDAPVEVAPVETATVDAAPVTAPEPAKPAEPEVTFDDLGLSDEILRAVKETGYTIPTPIQAKGIPQVLMGRDIIGIAQTGTGKTASFTLPMIEILARGRAKARMPRSLILAPTRELAAQVSESFERYGKYNKLSMALLIGGVSFDEQDRKLDRGVDVLIATPGRLMDHFERGKLMLTGVQVLVIDEADRMLDMGFIPDVEKICKLLPFTRQTLFYSATMPPEITRLTEQFLHNPARVEVSRPATTAANITQEIIEVPNNDWAKRETLRRLIKDNAIKNGIIFCNRKRDVDVVARSLSKHGFSAAPLHGDLDQSVRTRTLEEFKSGELQLLIASDVAARGLDIPAVSHIFNYDAPFHADDYVHRIGRTGRAGRSGHAFMLVSSRDAKSVDAIEKLIKQTLPRRKIEGIEPREDLKPRGGERDRDRHGGRDRGRGRDRDRSRPIKDHGQRASMEPIESVAHEAAPVEAIAQPEPQKTEKPRRERGRGHSKSQERANAPAELPAAGELPPHMEGATADAIQLPHFLLRPVKLPVAKTAEEEAAELAEAEASHAAEEAADAAAEIAEADDARPARKPRARRGRTRTSEANADETKSEDADADTAQSSDVTAEAEPVMDTAPQTDAVAEEPAEADAETPKPKRPARKRAPRARKAVKSDAEAASDASTDADAADETVEADAQPTEDRPKRKVARKRAPRARKAAQTDATDAPSTDEVPATAENTEA